LEGERDNPFFCPGKLLANSSPLGLASMGRGERGIWVKYIFLAGKIIRVARSVVLKLSINYLYQEIYAKSLP
jgi:hypothetical protein